MYVRHLQLGSFRSWERVDLALGPGPRCFVGRNGEGKTNLVEAVGYLATMSSHRVSSDAPLVRHGAARRSSGRPCAGTTASCWSRSRSTPAGPTGCGSTGRRCPGRGSCSGLVRTVLFAPEDLALVRGDPTERRRFLDELLVTRTPRLAGVRSDYDRVLKQRNALLKTARLARGKAIATLDVWDGHLTDLGGQLLAARLRLVADLPRTWPRPTPRSPGRTPSRPRSATPARCPLAGDGAPLRAGDDAARRRRADRRHARAGRRAARRRGRPRR